MTATKSPRPGDLVRLLKANHGRHSMHRVFTDWVEISAIALRNRIDPNGYAEREATYERIRSEYTPTEMDRFAQALALLVNEMEDNPRDVLGDTYMSLEIADKNSGQFFTPYSVAQAIAALQLEGLIHALDRKPYITVGEPACGAGALVIALTQALATAGINYQQRIHVTAEDISPVAVHMIYIQLTLLHVPAIVHRRNSLALETFDTWLTPAHVLGGWSTRLRLVEEARGAEQLNAGVPLDDILAHDDARAS